ncbi:MAG: cobalamin-binding protein [Cellvibrionaceae bacterium]
MCFVKNKALCFFCLFFFLSVSNILAADIVVVDDVGRTVVLKNPAKRIVALAPHIVENLFSAGAGDKIVAVVEYSDYPEAAKKIERVGRFDTVSIERILALSPDLVVVWGSGGGIKLIEKFKSLGLTVYVDEPSTLHSVANSIDKLSVLAGTELAGKVAATKFIDELQRLKSLNVSQEKPKVFYQLWNNPIQTVSGHHVISDAIALCGGENVFAKTKSIAPKVNLESVLSKNPDVIIASGTNEKRPEWLDAWKQWSSLSAVKSSNTYHIPPDYIQRHTLRILDGVRLMCEYIKKSHSKQN